MYHYIIRRYNNSRTQTSNSIRKHYYIISVNKRRALRQRVIRQYIYMWRTYRFLIQDCENCDYFSFFFLKLLARLIRNAVMTRRLSRCTYLYNIIQNCILVYCTKTDTRALCVILFVFGTKRSALRTRSTQKTLQ